MHGPLLSPDEHSNANKQSTTQRPVDTQHYFHACTAHAAISPLYSKSMVFHKRCSAPKAKQGEAKGSPTFVDDHSSGSIQSADPAWRGVRARVSSGSRFPGARPNTRPLPARDGLGVARAHGKSAESRSQPSTRRGGCCRARRERAPWWVPDAIGRPLSVTSVWWRGGGPHARKEHGAQEAAPFFGTHRSQREGELFFGLLFFWSLRGEDGGPPRPALEELRARR